jgi:hypothetical protein
MSNKLDYFNDIFAETDRDKFVLEALNAQKFILNVSSAYVGNKKKILSDIGAKLYDNLDFVNINTICDLFAGSAVVGGFFKILGKKVFCNELLQSTYMNGLTLLNGSLCKITNEEWEFLKYNVNETNDHFIENKFAEKRFTRRESRFIDNYFHNCQELLKGRDLDYCIAQSVMMQCIMTYCYVGGRLNCGQIIASLAHRLQHVRNNHAELNFSELEKIVTKMPGVPAQFTRSDVIEFLQTNKQSFDMIYIDPPYGGEQSDYARMYQFFEEYLSRKNYKDIEYLKNYSKRFGKDKTYKDSFIELLQNLPQDSIWVFSYNNSSWADVDTITKIIQDFRNKVIVEKIEYNYKYRTAHKSEGFEYIIIGH